MDDLAIDKQLVYLVSHGVYADGTKIPHGILVKIYHVEHLQCADYTIVPGVCPDCWPIRAVSEVIWLEIRFDDLCCYGYGFVPAVVKGSK